MSLFHRKKLKMNTAILTFFFQIRGIIMVFTFSNFHRKKFFTKKILRIRKFFKKN